MKYFNFKYYCFSFLLNMSILKLFILLCFSLENVSYYKSFWHWILPLSHFFLSQFIAVKKWKGDEAKIIKCTFQTSCVFKLTVMLCLIKIVRQWLPNVTMEIIFSVFVDSAQNSVKNHHCQCDLFEDFCDVSSQGLNFMLYYNCSLFESWMFQLIKHKWWI